LKKYKWLIAGIATLFLITAVTLNISGKSTTSMDGECVEDGSCCTDENSCTC
jgi:hypothetical protein